MTKRNMSSAILFAGLVPAIGFAQPLNPQQKQLALNTYQAATLNVAVVNSLNPDYVPGTIGSDALSQKFVQMSDLLKASAQTQKCQVQSTKSKDKSGQIVSRTFQLSGSQCQVVASGSTNSHPGTSTNQNDFKVQDATFSALTDVDSFTNTTNSSGSLDAKHIVHISISGNGSCHSKAAGKVSLTATGSGTFDMQGNGTIVIHMVGAFPGFNADLEFDTTAKAGTTSSTVYKLNGSVLSDAEVNTYINLPFAPRPAQGTLLNEMSDLI